MKLRSVLIALVGSLALALAGAQGALAGKGHGHGQGRDHGQGGKAVFVQTNEPAGNQIAVYDRGHDGTLTRVGTYATGGLGAHALPGTESDTLASQGSLVLVRHRMLIAVNAGSDTISVFRVHGDRLDLQQVLPSGGQFPASIAARGRLVYVLNSGGAGILQGFRIHGHWLTPIPGSTRSLGLANGDPPNFLMSPGQAGFTPNGGELIVTTKASGSLLDVFLVGHDGLLSATPVENPSATPVPFAFTFGAGRLVVGEAATSSVTTYELLPGGALADPRSQSDGQTALCWITRAHGFYFVSNTASDNVSSFRIGESGQPALVAPVAGTTNPGPIDQAASGPFLYVETGMNGTVDAFRVAGDGTLVPLGSVNDLPPGIEGIAAS